MQHFFLQPPEQTLSAVLLWSFDDKETDSLLKWFIGTEMLQ